MPPSQNCTKAPKFHLQIMSLSIKHLFSIVAYHMKKMKLQVIIYHLFGGYDLAFCFDCLDVSSHQCMTGD